MVITLDFFVKFLKLTFFESDIIISFGLISDNSISLSEIIWQLSSFVIWQIIFTSPAFKLEGSEHTAFNSSGFVNFKLNSISFSLSKSLYILELDIVNS